MRHLNALPDLPDLSDVTVTLLPQGTDHTDRTVPLVGYLVLAPAGTQPAQLTELLAAVPRAAPAGPAPAPEPARGPAPADHGIAVDQEERTVTVDGRPLRLTYLEFELLAHLVGHPQRVWTREQLVETIWGYGPVGDQRTVDVHVARLRRKLGAAYRERIVTVRRVGYKYVPPAG
ncbi:winged helix-turn-helix domain-containing protein [Streptomyces marincola]|uniref:winged helix-turn-helix domain-containing protein n=1 Tax=Streptomyces marincola TaxID=2878388 RepID=UPI001CF43A42|nr:winged helix-turn-helix domain-containing protein [Streptomyces marincola]UCM90975.1 winged helix-turn-helix domain-containing protein [Streptomyces marincola]